MSAAIELTYEPKQNGAAMVALEATVGSIEEQISNNDSLFSSEEKQELEQWILDKLCDKLERLVVPLRNKKLRIVEEWQKTMFPWLTMTQVDQRLLHRRNRRNTVTAQQHQSPLDNTEQRPRQRQRRPSDGDGNPSKNVDVIVVAENEEGIQKQPQNQKQQSQKATKNNSKATTKRKRATSSSSSPSASSSLISQDTTKRDKIVQPLDLRTRIYKLKDEVTTDYGWLKGIQGSKKKLPKGTLEKLIEKKKKEYGLQNVEIKAETIRSRWKKELVGVPVKHGNSSPLESIEPRIIAEIQKRNLDNRNGNNPSLMKKHEILQYTNELIQSSTEVQKAGLITVGNGWYENFRGRWQPTLVEMGYPPKMKRSKTRHHAHN